LVFNSEGINVAILNLSLCIDTSGLIFQWCGFVPDPY